MQNVVCPHSTEMAVAVVAVPQADNGRVHDVSIHANAFEESVAVAQVLAKAPNLLFVVIVGVAITARRQGTSHRIAVFHQNAHTSG